MSSLLNTFSYSLPEQEPLPDLDIKDFNTISMEEEVMIQHARATRLFDLTSRDNAATPAHKAQTLVAITNLLAQMVKLQEQVHNIEEVKKIQAALIKTLKGFPEVKKEFMSVYKGNLDAE